MYTVEVKILTVAPSITYLPTEMTDEEWSDLVTVPQLETDQEELQEARKVAQLARKYYHSVRITEGTGNGMRRIVR